MKTLYVGNLPFQASEEDLRDWFSRAGITVANVNLIRDRFSGEPRGFGFVEISSDAEAQQAIQTLNGQEYVGRKLVINEARPKREGGGGGRGRGGAGRGRRRDW